MKRDSREAGSAGELRDERVGDLAGRTGDAHYKGVFAHLIYILSDQFAKIFNRPSGKVTNRRTEDNRTRFIALFLLTVFCFLTIQIFIHIVIISRPTSQPFPLQF